jgi:hypothetical protein
VSERCPKGVTFQDAILNFRLVFYPRRPAWGQNRIAERFDKPNLVSARLFSEVEFGEQPACLFPLSRVS